MTKAKKVSKGRANPGTIGDLLREQGKLEFLNNHATQKIIEREQKMFAELRTKMYAFWWTTRSHGYGRDE